MKRIIWAPVAMSLALHVGCGGGDNASNIAPMAPARDVATMSTPGSAPEQSQSQMTPALAVSTKATGGAVQLPEDPKEIIRVFMDAIRSGNGEQLEALFSSAARIEVEKQGLEISPPGSAEAIFEVQEATAQEQSMIVSSKWIEPATVEGGEQTEIEILWELRKEAAGWRVCAMAADLGDGDSLEVVNFENIENSGNFGAGKPESRVAALPGATDANAMPALPPVGAALPAQDLGGNSTIPGLPPANQLR